MFRRFAAMAFGTVLALGPVSVGAAQMAPQLVSSTPQDGATVHQAPDTVSMTFSEPLDPSSEIQIVDECGRRIDDGSTQVDLNQMSVGVAKKPSGRYTAGYIAKGPAGATGEGRGSILFTVHSGSACDGKGGGHDGHGGGSGGKDGGKGGGHDDHGSGGGGPGSGSGSGSGSNHGSHSGGSTSASSSHSGSSGTHAAGNHSGSSGHGGNMKHGKGKGHGPGHGKGRGKNGDHDDHQAGEVDGRTIAAPGDGLPPVNGESVLLALGACLLIGASGGLLVRMGGIRL